jgi:oligopeptide/dipeptide ABC transporter ATP-binding protein
MSGHSLLSVDNLTVAFSGDSGSWPVVENVSFSLEPGETLGLVGESGCGKSVTAQTIMRLLPSPPSKITAGKIVFEGTDLVALPEKAIRKIRGNAIGMIFQEPMTSLNPTQTIGDQIAEVLVLHKGLSYSAAKPYVLEVLGKVGIGNAERRMRQYPHELSGGLRQRVMIAMAIICEPKLLIADEPTTALDVTIQAQILELLKDLQRDLGLSILMITHDLGVVSEMCKTVVVMYAGRVVETGPVDTVFASPAHPYTAGLLASSPGRAKKGERMPSIPGMVPPPSQRGAFCSFADRCSRALPHCTTSLPPDSRVKGSLTACWNPVP